jgi:hypothetical protein
VPQLVQACARTDLQRCQREAGFARDDREAAEQGGAATDLVGLRCAGEVIGDDGRVPSERGGDGIGQTRGIEVGVNGRQGRVTLRKRQCVQCTGHAQRHRVGDRVARPRRQQGRQHTAARVIGPRRVEHAGGEGRAGLFAPRDLLRPGFGKRLGHGRIRTWARNPSM